MPEAPSFHPLLNACLNAASFVALCYGWARAKRHDAEGHKKAMLAALALSAAFLVSYVVYHYSAGHTVFPGTGIAKVVYLAILFTHIPLAVVMVPMILVAVNHAFKGRIEKHRRIVRWAFPVWAYVSITGVIVYVMLYRMDWT